MIQGNDKHDSDIQKHLALFNSKNLKRKNVNVIFWTTCATDVGLHGQSFLTKWKQESSD